MSKYNEDGKEIVVDEITEEQRKAAFEAISKKAILINLERRQINNLPFDVPLSEEVAKTFNVKEPEMIQVRKFLFNPQHLSEIRSIVNDTLLLLFNYTRPWENIGYRLLPMKYYDDFQEQFSKAKDEFEEAVQKFIDNYDDYIAESKNALGKAFNKRNYPDKSQVKDLFELAIDTANFPEIDDIRLNMTGPELMELKEEVAEQYTGEALNSMNATLDIVEKVDGDVGYKMVEIVESMNNVCNNADVSVRIAEIKTKLNYTPEEERPEDMMVMGDLDDMDVDLECDEEEDACEIEDDDEDKDLDFGFKEAL